MRMDKFKKFAKTLSLVLLGLIAIYIVLFSGIYLINYLNGIDMTLKEVLVYTLGMVLVYEFLLGIGIIISFIVILIISEIRR